LIETAQFVRFEYKPPISNAEEVIRKYAGQRSLNMTYFIEGVFGEYLWKSPYCPWCGSYRREERRRIWCGSDCQQSAFVTCNPQALTSKGFIFMDRQDCTCLACGLNIEDRIKAFIPIQYERNLASIERQRKFADVSKMTPTVKYFHIGSLIGSRFDLDHKIPIFKGGSGIGLENVQVICAGCHKIKTSKERKHGSS